MSAIAPVKDLTALHEVTENSVVEALRQRFDQGDIFTGLGNAVVVKVNPFEKIKKNEKVGNDSPSIDRLAEIARENAVRTGKPQSCMMNGESGAGKTEATKRYLKVLADKAHCVNQDLHVQLANSCTLLESFGNASTEHNKNSSRFARWFQLIVDRKDGKIVSGNVHQYLLEKARVVKGSSTSSNFHVLYDICTSASPDAGPHEVEQPQDNFAYLHGRVGSGDNNRFFRMECELQCLGVADTDPIKDILWCVLHLGNLTFVPTGDQEGCSLDPKSTHSAGIVARLLGIDSVDSVVDLFVQKRLKIGAEEVFKKQTIEQASDSRDALAKDLYFRLFKWVVQTINKSIDSKSSAFSTSDEDEGLVSIGLLDVFGFECFETNSFEQLCINYCNEKLVQQFHGVLVEAELKVCTEEGVPMDRLNLAASYQEEAERKVKVIRGIDEAFKRIQDETRLPKATDQTLTKKLLELELGDHNKQTRMAGTVVFTINHYAGNVAYTVTGFLEKNKDEGPVDITNILFKESSNQFIKGLYQDEEEPATRSPRASSTKKTLGIQFRDQFSTLADSLAQSNQQFVMCVKPNREAMPGVFEESLVRRQLECNGLLAICQVRKSAFASHLPFGTFVDRFRLVNPASICTERTEDGKALALIKSIESIRSEDYFIGKSRILLRQAAVSVLSKRLEVIFGNAATRITNFVRANYLRKRFQLTKRASIKIQSTVRSYLARKQVAHLRAQRAATLFQCIVRGYLARVLRKRLFKERTQRNAAVGLQRFIRGAFLVKQARAELVRLRAAKIAAEKERLRLERLAEEERVRAAEEERLRQEKLAEEERLRAEALAAAEEEQQRAEEAERIRQEKAAEERKSRLAAATLAAQVMVTQRSGADMVRSSKESAADMSQLNEAVMSRPTIPKGRRRGSSAIGAAVAGGVAVAAVAASASAVSKTSGTTLSSSSSLKSQVISETATVNATSESSASATLPPPILTANSKPPPITTQEMEDGDAVSSVMESESPVAEGNNFSEEDAASPVSIGAPVPVKFPKVDQLDPEMEDPETTNPSSIDDDEHFNDIDTDEPQTGNAKGDTRLEQEVPSTVDEEATSLKARKQDSSRTSAGVLEEAADRVQRNIRAWLARKRMMKLRKKWSQITTSLKAQKIKMEEQENLSQYPFTQNSKTFKTNYGKTEESYYDDLSRRVGEYKYLTASRSAAEQRSPSRGSDNTQSVRKELQHALEKRDFRSLMQALRAAYAVHYAGPELFKAESMLAQIRKVHIKQLEAEKVLKEQLGSVST